MTVDDLDGAANLTITEALAAARHYAALSTISRVRVLSALARSPPMTQKAMAERLDESPQSVAYSIKVLVDAGLVKETRSLPRKTVIERYFGLTELGQGTHWRLLRLARRDL